MTLASPSTPRRRTKRVSAQHTQERVRNNQRRHRARRKDYMAALEQKLYEAEQTISTLRNQVQDLQASTHDQKEADGRTRQLPRRQSQQGTSPPPRMDADGQAVPASSQPAETENLEAWELPGLAATGTESAKDQAVAETESLLPATTTTPCCSHDLSSEPQPTVDTTNQTTPVLLPGYVLQPAMEASYQAWPYSESTMPCSKAYILIAQQNFKAMNQGDVDAWLWNGFRKSLQPSEGCRVQTDILFSLLAFISDTSSEVLAVTPQHDQH